MKKITLLCILCFVVSACSPSQTAIQTAIAQTQLAIPTATFTQTAIPIPTATIVPSSTLTLTPAPITLEALIAAFKSARLEAEGPTLMSHTDYGLAPYLCKGAHFYTPSVCSDCGGRVFVCPNQDDLNALQSYYQELGRQSAALYSWVFSKNNVLIQINGDMQESVARNYETVLNSIVK